jgi:hypothetical protein
LQVYSCNPIYSGEEVEIGSFISEVGLGKSERPYLKKKKKRKQKGLGAWLKW